MERPDGAERRNAGDNLGDVDLVSYTDSGVARRTMAEHPLAPHAPTGGTPVSERGSDRRRGDIRPLLVDVTRSEGSPRRGASIGRDTSEEPQPPDAELIAAIASGDVGSLEQLYDRYSALVFSVGLRVLNDRQLAEDVAQEVFLRVWRRPLAYDPDRGRFISWLMSVTRNRAIDEQRRQSRRLRSEENGDNPAREVPSGDRLDDPQAAALYGEERRAVREALTRLPPEQRYAIELAYFGGLTQVEIAERTGDPLGTVKTRIRLGMRKLRDSLTELLDGHGGDGDGSMSETGPSR
jgi:RNA polymerase sigma-70 factor (ECF subfamily)